MTLRDRLIDILIQADKECDSNERYPKYPCEGCKYIAFDRNIHGCIFEKYADAIIESNLIKDDKVYKPIKKEDPFTHANNYWCSACETFIGSGIYGATTRYCPKCGKKIKE